jgi:hypothetical protein
VRGATKCRIYGSFCLTLSCAAQSPATRPRFEVASVTRSLSGCDHGPEGNLIGSYTVSGAFMTTLATLVGGAARRKS